MAVGIRIRGQNSQLQISDDAPTFMHLFTSSFNGSTNPPGDALGNNGPYYMVQTVWFPQVVTTNMIPLVFMNVVNDVMIYKFGVIGSPGNWTGFRIMSMSGSNGLGGVAADYFVAVSTVAKSNDPIGIRIRNKNTNEIIFDSGYRLVNFQSYATSLNYGYSAAWGRNMYFVYKPAGSYQLMNQYTGFTTQGGNAWQRGGNLWLSYYQGEPNKVSFWTSTADGAELGHSQYIWSIVFATVGS